MDKLLQQIKSPQPEVKIPKAKLAKPKHKVGDIIIVRTGLKENDPENCIWNIEECKYNFIYSQEIANKIYETITPPYDAHDKYIAILCVGTEKVLHSQYVNDIFDEYSVYAFYDYISEEKPTVEQLSECGFLPSLVMYAQDNSMDIATLEWRYKFMLYSESFKIGSNSCEQSFEKLSCTLEHNRFQNLFATKNYSDEVTDTFNLYDTFYSFFEEKVRLTLAKINYDNLLDSKVENPPLRTKEEISKISKQVIEEEWRKIESNN